MKRGSRERGTTIESFLRAAALLAAAVVHACALAPGSTGSADGDIELAGERVALRHAMVLQRDNAEGLLQWQDELRIALTDRELAPEALWGASLVPLTTMALEGKARGLLIRVDAASPDRAHISVLTEPTRPGEWLPHATLESSSRALRLVKIADGRVTGTIGLARADGMPSTAFVTFTAPVLHEPSVTEDLRGAAAQSSTPVRTLAAAGEALSNADRARHATYLTAAARARLERNFANPDWAKGAGLAMKQAGADIARELAKAPRVVVRGERALVLFGSGWVHSMAVENGAWKVDD